MTDVIISVAASVTVIIEVPSSRYSATTNLQNYRLPPPDIRITITLNMMLL